MNEGSNLLSLLSSVKMIPIGTYSAWKIGNIKLSIPLVNEMGIYN